MSSSNGLTIGEGHDLFVIFFLTYFISIRQCNKFYSILQSQTHLARKQKTTVANANKTKNAVTMATK